MRLDRAIYIRSIYKYVSTYTLGQIGCLKRNLHVVPTQHQTYKSWIFWRSGIIFYIWFLTAWQMNNQFVQNFSQIDEIFNTVLDNIVCYSRTRCSIILKNGEVVKKWAMALLPFKRDRNAQRTVFFILKACFLFYDSLILCTIHKLGNLQ